MTVNVRTVAMSYAARGWPIFRCKPGGKAPATPQGFKNATADPAAIDRMFSQHRTSNVATPTGVLFDVLDLDVKPASDRNPGGVNAMLLVPRLQRGGWLAGAVGSASTRNGGMHVYFPAGGLDSASIAHLGVDFKANGGYVLLPPSKVASDFPNLTGRYRWTRGQLPDVGTGSPLDWAGLRAELDPRPEPVHQEFTGRSDPGRRLQGLVRTIRDAAEGNRNHVLFWAACALGDDGQLDQNSARELAGAALAVGLGEWETEQTITSARRHTGGSP